MVKQRTREQQNSINSIETFFFNESSAHMENLGAWCMNEFSLFTNFIFLKKTAFFLENNTPSIKIGSTKNQ